MLNIDVQGASTIIERAVDDLILGSSLVTVFLYPANLGELEKRLRGWGDDSEGEIIRRLAIAETEIVQKKIFDHVLVSGTRGDDLEALIKLIDLERVSRNKS